MDLENGKQNMNKLSLGGAVFVKNKKKTVTAKNSPRASLDSKPRRIGERAVLKYFNNYKEIERSVDHSFSPPPLVEKRYRNLPRKVQLKPLEDEMTSQQAYLLKISRLKLLPRTNGLVHWKGNEQEINSKDFHVGDMYASAFAEALKKAEAVKINLSNNDFSEKSSLSILQGVSMKVQDLNLSNNKIGSFGIDFLSAQLKKPESALISLNLENSGISDKMCQVLFSTLQSKEAILEKLNLSKNNISDKGIKSIAELLENNRNLHCLIMHWN